MDNNNNHNYTPLMNKTHIGVYEFCRRTNRDVTSVYKLLSSGKIEGARKVGNGIKRMVWQIPETVVDNWLKVQS